MDYLFLFSPKGESMLNIKGKGRPRRRGATLWGRKSNYTAAASAAVNCCETREEEENPNPAAVDSRRKRRPTRID